MARHHGGYQFVLTNLVVGGEELVARSTGDKPTGALASFRVFRDGQPSADWVATWARLKDKAGNRFPSSHKVETLGDSDQCFFAQHPKGSIVLKTIKRAPFNYRGIPISVCVQLPSPQWQ
ncbi:MAG: hypothetical protein CMO80_11150 [Verrucomicrobiales bacterium]|nr:hypothetical protein [Verrucomicrobiales bacterium]